MKPKPDPKQAAFDAEKTVCANPRTIAEATRVFMKGAGRRRVKNR